MTDLTPNLNGDSHADSITQNGQVAGVMSRCPFLWQNGVVTELSILEAVFERCSFNAAYVNDFGQVAAWTSYSYLGTAFTVAFLLDNGNLTSLGSNIGPGTNATHINDKGQIAGRSGFHAALWQNGVITDLGILPGGNPLFGSVLKVEMD